MKPLRRADTGFRSSNRASHTHNHNYVIEVNFFFGFINVKKIHIKSFPCFLFVQQKKNLTTTAYMRRTRFADIQMYPRFYIPTNTNFSLTA